MQPKNLNSKKLLASKKIKKKKTKKPILEIEKPFEEKNEESLNDSDQEFIAEMMAEMDGDDFADDQESLLGEEKPDSNKLAAGDMNVIEVDEAFLGKIKLRVSQGAGKALVRLSIQIFNSAFNERDIAGEGGGVSRKYVIFDPSLLNDFLNIYLRDIPHILKKVNFFDNNIIFHINSFNIKI